MKHAQILSIVICLAISTALDAEVERWYTPDQTQLGQQIYQKKCAKCHGDNAEGELDWRRQDEEGEYPPPPLNGDAYAWYLNIDQMRHQIQVGSDEDEGDMPSFRGKLDEGDIDSVIAFFQSNWNDLTYILWYSRQRPDFTTWSAPSTESQKQEGTRWLKQHFSTVDVVPGEPLKTPVKGISEVRIGDDYVYLSEDGQYAFTGEMIDLRNGDNLTRANRAIETKRLLRTYPVNDMLVYKADGEEKTQVTIFTDTTCRYCRKLHKEVPKLQSSGITVRLIPYPRRGLDSIGYRRLKSIWCAEHPRKAFDDYVETRNPLEVPEDCQQARAVDAGYLLGNSVGISSTPTLVLENGKRIRGYKSAEKLISRMGALLD